MEASQFERIAKALSDPRRVVLLEKIVGKPGLSCGEVETCIEVSQSTVSHHIRILHDSGLITIERQGQHGLLTAVPDVMVQYLAELQKRLLAKAKR